MNDQQCLAQINAWRNGVMTAEQEYAWLQELSDPKTREQVLRVMEEMLETNTPAVINSDDGAEVKLRDRWQPVLERILESDRITQTPVVPITRRMKPWRWIAAASVVLLIGISAYLWNDQQKKNRETTRINPVPVKTDVPAPVVARALLTLADGKQIALDSTTAGTITKQGKVTVTKKETGEIVYTGVNETAMYNTLTNPRGSKVISTILSDGSKVWLNAESSIRYPITFVGKERKVEITGEAYFEVTHDAKKKFIVEANGITTEVLGTHFNVNAYGDEQTKKVTLLEGKVKVTASKSEETLLPGEQAQISETTFRKEANVDIEQVVAWKNGLFRFSSADIKTLMKQVARWYDIEVVYKGATTQDRFTGGIPRTATLRELLAILEDSRVHFTIEGKTLTVLP